MRNPIPLSDEAAEAIGTFVAAMHSYVGLYTVYLSEKYSEQEAPETEADLQEFTTAGFIDWLEVVSVEVEREESKGVEQ